VTAHPAPTIAALKTLPLDNPGRDREAGARDATPDTTRTDGVRVAAVRALVAPAVLREELPVTESVETLVETAPSSSTCGRRDTGPTSSSGARSAPARPRARAAASSRAGCHARSAPRTAPMAVCTPA